MSATISLSAQDSFYYYNGTKIPLQTVESKIVKITTVNPDSSPSSLPGLKVVNNFSDELSKVTVYENTNSLDSSILRTINAETEKKATILPVYKNENGLELVPTGYLYIELKNETDFPILEKEAAAFGCFIVRQNKFMPLWYTLHLSLDSQQNPIEVANTLYETGLFASAEPDFSFDPLEISYDPEVHNQWGLYNKNHTDIDINVSPAWNYSTGRGIKIAIVDEGVELTHDDLKNNLHSESYDAYTNSSPSKVYGTLGHGTHCAGIAAAIRNNNKMIAGVAPDANIISISTNFSGLNSSQQLADGINWAWKNGADVISCSWGSGGKSKIISDALDNAITKGRNGLGCVIVKSAGNNGDSITFPGNYREEIIAVANIESTGLRATDSSHGSNMFVSAPGTGILSTMVGNTTTKMSGTSMACPHVSGLAALILSRNPKLSAAQVREIIGKNTKKIGNIPYSTNKTYGSWNEYYGYGLIDAYEAVIHTPLY